jgi:hypothetical protein
MVNVDQHDHTGAPTKGVQISATGLYDGCVTYPKLNSNVVDTATGLGTEAAPFENRITTTGVLKELYQSGSLTNGQLYIGSTGNPAAKAALTAGAGISITPGAGSITIANTGALPGVVVQYVNTSSSALKDCTTIIPDDNTIPQNTEGDEVLTITIIPTSATNKLVIHFVAQGSVTFQVVAGFALFQDANANALAAVAAWNSAAFEGVGTCNFTHTMVAGTVAATTFKVRCGPQIAVSHVYLNGTTAGAKYGGVQSTTFEIYEIKV